MSFLLLLSLSSGNNANIGISKLSSTFAWPLFQLTCGHSHGVYYSSSITNFGMFKRSTHFFSLAKVGTLSHLWWTQIAFPGPFSPSFLCICQCPKMYNFYDVSYTWLLIPPLTYLLSLSLMFLTKQAPNQRTRYIPPATPSSSSPLSLSSMNHHASSFILIHHPKPPAQHASLHHGDCPRLSRSKGKVWSGSCIKGSSSAIR